MIKRVLLILLLEMGCMLIFLNCENSTEPKEATGMIAGSVRSVLLRDLAIIHPAYIFLADSLLATTDEHGDYLISSIEEGMYPLTCSALNYRDSTEQVGVLGRKTVIHNFYLTPDSSIGRVYGEFQDVTLYNQGLETNPSMADWDAKRIFDDVTGATVQAKTFGYEVPDREVFLGDSLLAISDAFGQYWFKIQCGTYPITGSCEWYYDRGRVTRVLPDTPIYVNFFLHRKEGTVAPEAVSRTRRAREPQR